MGHPAYFAPNGAILFMVEGQNIVFNFLYNKRLQPMLEYASAYASGQTQWLYKRCYDYHLGGGVNVTYGNVTCQFPSTTAADNGNVYQIQNKLDDNRTQNFSYDSLNRMQQAYTNGPNWGQNFTIDAWGNLTNVSQLTGKNLYGGLNAAPATNKNRLTGYSYDAAGNLLSDGLGHNFTYDAENRISAVSGNSAASYTYDGDGLRVKKSTGTLYWTGVGSDVLAESDLSGNLTAEYIFFNGMRVARVDRPSLKVHYFLVDHLGSNRIQVTPLNSTTVTVESDVDYTPYGIATSTLPDHYDFTGKERDSESGLDNFGARYYGSTLGRFMTPDWAAMPKPVPYANFGNPQSLNLYSYVKNNPTTLTDADGHCDVDGEHHNWVWCAAHAAGWVQTQQEKKQEEQRYQLAKATWEKAHPGKSYAWHLFNLSMQMTPMAGFGIEGAAAEGAEALAGANFAQRTFSETFSSAGTFAGKTVDEVAAALRTGELKAADVPIQYIVKDGQTLILNTRSAQALERAGIPRSQWYAVNMTGDAAAEARLAGQLQRNNLTNAGTPTVTPEQ